MRRLVAILATLALAQCVTADDDRFRVGGEADALIIIGVAKAPRDTSPRYTMLWRQVETDGTFSRLEGDLSFDAETNAADTVRVRGIPGEFEFERIRPGTYALDSVFGVIREGNVDYVAQGVILGPDRPAFDIAPGEAVYLGIWEMDIEGADATTRLWRLDEADIRAVVRASDQLTGPVRVRGTYSRPVPCNPHRAGQLSTRQVC
jgi:hypothetical protein